MVLIRTCSHREAWWNCWPPGGTACRQGGGKSRLVGCRATTIPIHLSPEPGTLPTPGGQRSPVLDITGVTKHSPFRHQLSTSHCKPCPPHRGLACFSSPPLPQPPPLTRPTPISAADATELKAALGGGRGGVGAQGWRSVIPVIPSSTS